MLFHVIHPAAGERRQAGFDVALMRQAAQAGPVACLWEADQSLVVPRTYRRHPPFAQACGQFARRGWPVAVRRSGGGLGPQGAWKSVVWGEKVAVSVDRGGGRIKVKK